MTTSHWVDGSDSHRSANDTIIVLGDHETKTEQRSKSVSTNVSHDLENQQKCDLCKKLAFIREDVDPGVITEKVSNWCWKCVIESAILCDLLAQSRVVYRNVQRRIDYHECRDRPYFSFSF